MIWLFADEHHNEMEKDRVDDGLRNEQIEFEHLCRNVSIACAQEA